MTRTNLKAMALAAVSAVVLAAPSAHAGAVVNWTGTDGFSAEPFEKGTNIVHLRLDSVFTGYSVGTALMPGLNITSAIADGVDLGIGGGFNFAGIGSATNNFQMGAIYPWIRAAVPLGIDNVKTGLMVGTSIPVNTTANPGGKITNLSNRMANEFFPGVTGLVDVYLGQLSGDNVPLTMGVNAGYARGITSGTNLLTGNLNFSLPVGGVILYEEQFVNYPVGSFSNGGLRLGLSVPVGDRLMFDVKPAALWDTNGSGTDWTFNPSIGASMKF